MSYHFKNLVFEGGGVKGIAYVGAMQVLEEKAILSNIKRVGGTSAGAINATMVALGYKNAEQQDVLWKLDFKNFLDSSWGIIRDTERLLSKYGWYKGDFFHEWIGKLINKKMGNPNVTFRELQEAGKPDLYVYGTNLSTHFGEVFCVEHTPTMRIADAVRISMSIPLFFAAVRNAREDVYVDGGVLNNYPVRLFDREKYIDTGDRAANARSTPYYDGVNQSFIESHPSSSPYVYNRQTLGFRLDSEKEIAVFRYGSEPQHVKIDDFFDYIKALITTIMDSQSNAHLHSDDWQRSIYINTLGVGTTDFGLSDDLKKKLEESGKKGATTYFDWFDNKQNQPVNRP